MTLRATYDVHGVTVGIEVSDAVGPDALVAIDRRLRTWRIGRDATTDIGIEVGAEPLRPPAGAGRPVYDSAAGTVQYYDGAETLFAGHRGGAELSCNAAAGVAQLSCRPSSPDSVWLAAHPLLTLALIELLKRRQRYSLHAACVAADGRGILIAGPSGAGKTTLAVALVRSGLAFVSDDMVFLELAPQGIELIGFADEIDVTEQTLSMFEELRPAARRQLAGGGKWSLRLEDALDAPFVRTCRPSLLVLARVGNQDSSRLVSVSAAEALVDLAPNVLLTDAASAQAHLAALAQLVQTTPCVRLDTGFDLDELARLLLGACDDRVF